MTRAVVPRLRRPHADAGLRMARSAPQFDMARALDELAVQDMCRPRAFKRLR